MTEVVPNEQNTKLSVLLQLEKRARQADSRSVLFFLMVNETLSLVPYRQAFVSLKSKPVAISGVPSLDQNSPYMQWLEKLCDKIHIDETKPVEIERKNFPDSVTGDWQQWLPSHMLWVPLVHPRRKDLGGLVVVRDEPWLDADKALLGFLAETYGHALLALEGEKLGLSRFFGNLITYKKTVMVVVLVLLVFSFVPVRLTALGEAEVVPRDPAILRSPLEGVIDEIFVEPNDSVVAGDVLVQLDIQALSSSLHQAVKARDVEKVKLLQAKQLSLGDARYAGQVAVIEAMIEERSAEVDYLQEMQDLATLKSPVEGVAVFEDKAELIGRPVQIGEKIMSVARKTDSRLVVWLSTSDALTLESGAKIRLFLNTDPNHPIEATLVRSGFAANPRPEGYMAYRLEGEFDDANSSPRIGLRGVAKIYGDTASLGYYLFRKPYTALRQWFGI